MRRLLLLRHAKSSWSDPSLSDHDRPLSARGQRDMARMAKLLAEHRLRADVVLCSTALRARQTLEALIDTVPELPEPRYDTKLYLPTPEALFAELRRVPVNLETVLVVGHTPSLDALALAFLPPHACDVATRLTEKLPTGGLVSLMFEGRDARVWAPGWHGTYEQIQATACSLKAPRELSGRKLKPKRLCGVADDRDRREVRVRIVSKIDTAEAKSRRRLAQYD